MRNILYTIGIAGFLMMLIFTVVTSLSNPYYGMSEVALAQGSRMATTVECDCEWFGSDCTADGWGSTCFTEGATCWRGDSMCD